jgi:Na+-transporting NADH:ubiquinone oxidoreductase subunit NqrF
MSPYQDDDFSKAYTTAPYQTKGTVSTNVRVKSDENLEVDLLFTSRDAYIYRVSTGGYKRVPNLFGLERFQSLLQHCKN